MHEAAICRFGKLKFIGSEVYGAGAEAVKMANPDVVQIFKIKKSRQ